MKASELRELRDILCKKGDVIPDGWFTQNQIAEQLGLSRNQVKDSICKSTRDGTLEMRKFKVKMTAGVFPVPHYRPMKKNEKLKTR